MPLEVRATLHRPQRKPYGRRQSTAPGWPGSHVAQACALRECQYRKY